MVKFGLGVIAAALFATSALAINPDYGVPDSASAEEVAVGAKFGGYPNNQYFNNDTPCRAVARLFDKPGVTPADPQLRAFLTYSRVSLMLLDTAASVMLHEDPLVETVGKNWKVLPVLVPGYCRTHPKEKIGDVVVRAYNAARVTNGFQPAP